MAQEIGKLAEKTAINAKNITTHVKNGLNEVKKGRLYVDDTSTALKSIIDAIKQSETIVNKITQFSKEQENESITVLENTKRVVDVSGGIAYATGEQTNTNQELVKAIEHINQVTQVVASNSEEIATVVKEIDNHMNQMKEKISFFKK